MNEEAKDPVAKGGTEALVLEAADKFSGDVSVKLTVVDEQQSAAKIL